MNHPPYLSDIEDAFVRRRGSSLFLSSNDWQLMETWEQRSIPLHIVIAAIEDVFDKREAARNTSKVSSLSYCADAVEQRFAQYTASRVGASAEVSETATVTDYIGQFIDALRLIDRPEYKEHIRIAIERLVDLKASSSDDFDEAVDIELCDIEAKLTQSLVDNTDAETLDGIQSKIQKQMEPYVNIMQPVDYRGTFELMLHKAIRDAAGVPRLGLFYL